MLRFHILYIFRDYTIFFYFEVNEYFPFFLFYLFIFLGGGWGWGWGVAVEVILEYFISEIESFHVIYFYFHRSITQKLSVLHREAIKLPWRLTRARLRGVTTFIQETRL